MNTTKRPPPTKRFSYVDWLVYPASDEELAAYCTAAVLTGGAAAKEGGGLRIRLPEDKIGEFRRHCEGRGVGQAHLERVALPGRSNGGGYAIHYARRAKRLSREEVAARARVHVSDVAQAEYGYPVEPGKLTAIAFVVGVKIVVRPDGPLGRTTK